MTSHWKTHRGDEWWFTSQVIEADGWLKTTTPKAIEINFYYDKSIINEDNLYEFLCETALNFPLFEIWISKNNKIQTILMTLERKNLLTLQYFKNPLSVTIVITNVIMPSSNKYFNNKTISQHKQLKKLGKQINENNSAKLKNMITLSNPAPLGSNEWMQNYKQITIKEKEYTNNRSTVHPNTMVGKDVLLSKVDYNFQKGYLPISGYYLHCLKCGYLVPMNPAINVNCNCHQIIIDPLNKQISIPFNDIEVVKLMAIAKQKHSLIN